MRTHNENQVEAEATSRLQTTGGRYITPTVSDCLSQAVQHPGASAAPHQTLSDREYEVFIGIVGGSSLSDIAQKMHVSPKTVSTYRARVLEKMDATGNADLIRYAWETGLRAGQRPVPERVARPPDERGSPS